MSLTYISKVESPYSFDPNISGTDLISLVWEFVGAPLEPYPKGRSEESQEYYRSCYETAEELISKGEYLEALNYRVPRHLLTCDKETCWYVAALIVSKFDQLKIVYARYGDAFFSGSYGDFKAWVNNHINWLSVCGGFECI